MVCFRSFIIALAALGASAAPAPQAPDSPETTTEDRCAGVICPQNSYCKVFDFHQEKPVACQASGTLPKDAETCGSVVCPVGTTCCNSTCGVCTKPPHVCLQWVCSSDPFNP